MSEKEMQERDLLLKQLTRHYINEQLEALKSNKHDKNSSFIYLDSKTLNMLIVYLLAQIENQSSHGAKKIVDNEFLPEELVKELDSVINTNRKLFDDIISYLRDKT